MPRPQAEILGLTELEAEELARCAPPGVEVRINLVATYTVDAAAVKEVVVMVLPVLDKLGDVAAGVLGQWLFARFVQPYVQTRPDKAKHVRINQKVIDGLDAEGTIALVKAGRHAGLEQPAARGNHDEDAQVSHGGTIHHVSTPAGNDADWEEWRSGVRGLKPETLHAIAAACMEMKDYHAAALFTRELARRGEPKREPALESEHARGKSTIGETDNLSETEPSQQ